MSLDNPPPHLLRAVSSNSSLNSISSLTRRPRAKARSKTVASDSAPADAAVQATGTSYLGSDIVQEPLSSTDADGITLEQSRSEEPNTASNTIPDSARLSKTAQQASRLSSIKTGFKPPPSAFSRVPLSQIDSEPSAVNIRDSVLTQDSEITQQTHSSSVYPLSTLSASTTSHPLLPIQYQIKCRTRSPVLTISSLLTETMFPTACVS
ncbi:hypothetical protein D9757_008013 [Collybiopsis confluens]|uniref:Uncharacterized protein n=1 Tax=Collybiopsis confluens TaxID=2823264 RepID=A0A8H5M1G0_9AGAR|nr:hypothetical protein D9757_008013 [Collybiopsis confluens]